MTAPRYWRRHEIDASRRHAFDNEIMREIVISLDSSPRGLPVQGVQGALQGGVPARKDA